MGAAALFLPGDGDLFIPVSIRLAGLSKGKILSRQLVYHALIDCLRPGMTETSEAVTDRFLRNNSPWLQGYSVSFIQKGLRTLEELGIIERHPRHGRRRIVIKVRLRGRARHRPGPGPHPAPGPTPSPPSPTSAPSPTPPPSSSPPHGPPSHWPWSSRPSPPTTSAPPPTRSWPPAAPDAPSRPPATPPAPVGPRTGSG